MTNPAASTATVMSTRRPTVAPTGSYGSYASVLSGQTRGPGYPNGGGNARVPSHYSAAAGYGAQQSPQPATVPSYLTDSLYAERLASRATVFTPASASPRKPPQSHRGLVFDVVEHPPAEDEPLSPLPTRWNDADKSLSIELLNNGAEAKYMGPAKVGSEEAAAVRADRPMPPQCGLFYFEVTVVAKGKEGFVGIGFCSAKASLSKPIGWDQDSWGYHGDDGKSFCCQGSTKSYGPKFSTNDVIGCGVNFRTNTAFFTKNGTFIGTAFRDIKKGKLYPVVGMKKEKEHVRVNFGQDRFVFDIDNYMKNEKRLTFQEIHASPATDLYPPFDETALIQALVSQYLAHDGYVKTARAFAEDVHKESRALDIHNGEPEFYSDAKSDADAVNRQRIRTAILKGDVDHALKLTNLHYPSVLKDKELLFFRLRRRKLVEMIRQVAETVRDGPVGVTNGHDRYHDMDIDEPTGEIDWESMDVENGEVPQDGKVKSALDAAVEYGQNLRIEFSSDTRPEIKKPLDEAFSLLAYTDPSNSVLAHLLDEEGRIADAEELNSAILVSLGKSSDAALERLIKQSSILLQDVSQDGGPAAFVNLRTDYLRDPPASHY